MKVRLIKLEGGAAAPAGFFPPFLPLLSRHTLVLCYFLHGRK
nr:MAG TPA: hypothetical protein [Caudoviricetes sp.]